MSEAVASALQH